MGASLDGLVDKHVNSFDTRNIKAMDNYRDIASVQPDFFANSLAE